MTLERCHSLRERDTHQEYGHTRRDLHVRNNKCYSKDSQLKKECYLITIYIWLITGEAIGLAISL